MEINELSEKIIGCSYEVYNTLGYGFLEKVYENSLVVELKKRNLDVKQQEKLTIYYKDNIVGDYYADLIVENAIIIELKSTKEISNAHKMQLLNYLKATHIKLGLLINFSPTTVEIRRIAN